MSSPSTKRAYKACNHRHFLVKIKKLSEVETCHARRGRQAHSFLEEYGRECARLKIPSSPSVFSALLDTWDAKPNMTAEDKDDLFSSVRRMRDTIEFAAGTQFELKFAFTADWKPCAFDDPNRIYRGIIDLIVTHDRTRVTIKDYKSGWGKKGYPEQLLDYVLPLFFWMPDLQLVETGWIFTRHGLFTPGPSVTRAEAMKYFDRFVADLREMDRPRETWEPNGLGAECNRCGVTRHCKYFQDMVKSGLDGTDLKTVLEVYQRMAVLKAQAGLDDVTVKAFAKANGMIHLPNGKVFTNCPKPSVNLASKAEPSALFERALKAGFTPTEVINLLDPTAGQVKNIVEAAEKKGTPRAFFQDLIYESDRADWREAEISEIRTGVDPEAAPKEKTASAKRAPKKTKSPAGDSWMLP